MKFKTLTVYLLLVLSILMALVSAIITYYNTQEKNRSLFQVIRRYQTISSSAQVLSLVKDMETGQRGYIISGDSEFLEPYNQAKELVSVQLDSLRKLLVDNEPQTQLLEGKIIQVVNHKCNDLDQSIRLANSFGTDSAARRVNTKVGQAHMDTLRILIADLIHREHTLLNDQNKELEENTWMEDTVRFIAFTLIGLTSLVAYFTLMNKQKNINHLVNSLQEANENLERKIKERTEELVAANQAKDTFLGIASHDLKVPIAGVLSLIKLLKSGNTIQSKKDIEYLSYMEDSCNTMQGLIHNLLDINRLESGATKIEKIEVNIHLLLNKLNTEFSHQAHKKNIELIISNEIDIIKTDAESLIRVLENLLSNAIKFSHTGKSVELRVSNDHHFIRFDIVDEGPGIPIEEIPSLFNSFNKLSNKPTGGEGSSGLGLSIVKALSALLGGEITVSSEVGKGSTFTVLLPK